MQYAGSDFEQIPRIKKETVKYKKIKYNISLFNQAQTGKYSLDLLWYYSRQCGCGASVGVGSRAQSKKSRSVQILLGVALNYSVETQHT